MNSYNKLEWMKEASCLGLDVNLFFPERGEVVDPMVKKLCSLCPVKEECLKYALTFSGELSGYFGGTYESQRAKIKQSRRKITL
jgi:WhiB family redox-sensing transcriptional regulator